VCESDPALAQVIQKGCGVSFLRDIQKPYGHSPEQPAVGGPDWAGDLGPDDFQRSLPISTVL